MFDVKIPVKQETWKNRKQRETPLKEEKQSEVSLSMKFFTFGYCGELEQLFELLVILELWVTITSM
jgi:hypothetical protein